MKKSRCKLSVLIVAPIMVLIGVIFCLYSFYPKKFDGEVKTFSAINGLDESLIYAVIKVESGFDENKVSLKGASGLMQLMPTTANFVAEDFFKESVGDIFNPAINIRYGTRYLRYLIDKFGDIPVALAAYNAGEGKVRLWLEDESFSFDGKTLCRIPYPETEEYVKKVLEAQNFYKILYNTSS